MKNKSKISSCHDHGTAPPSSFPQLFAPRGLPAKASTPGESSLKDAAVGTKPSALVATCVPTPPKKNFCDKDNRRHTVLYHICQPYVNTCHISKRIIFLDQLLGFEALRYAARRFVFQHGLPALEQIHGPLPHESDTDSS